MDAGTIAQGLFETSIGVFGMVLSIFRKNDPSESASIIRKYNTQVLLVFGVLMLFNGIKVFVDDRKSEPELAQEDNSYSFSPEQNYEMDDTNSPLYKITIPEQEN